MGLKHRAYLSGNKVYSCSKCRTHMATIESMISRRFNGQHGQAYLFDTVFNVLSGPAEDRQMTTGLHRVCDIACAKCGQTMGWKYEWAYEPSQKYKEGKSILEKALLVESIPELGSPSPSTPPPANSGAMTAHQSYERIVTSLIAGRVALPSMSPGQYTAAGMGADPSATPRIAQLISAGSAEPQSAPIQTMGGMFLGGPGRSIVGMNAQDEDGRSNLSTRSMSVESEE